ncbi:MAG: flagellar transcriptional regulator FlhD [Paraburkholderia sp.]|jgi:flagellar transcriptional activator FlhD|nr:flagellar transcriptional regulator FlhD [Paraburkholderia sp.]
MSATTPGDMLSEINEVNLSYLLLAQRLLREDRPAGVRRMGISEQLADVLARLTAAQAARLAASSQLLCRFRFDEHAILSALAEKGKAAQIHSAMFMAARSVEQAG